MPTPPLPSDLARPRLEQVGVFIDYENAHRTAHGIFEDYGTPRHCTVFNPAALAERIVAKRRRPSELSHAHVYRGRPVPERQPIPASAFDIQRREWESGRKCTVHYRDLKYEFPYDDPTQYVAREKGVDVELAVQVAEACFRQEYQAIILFSNDTDLLPVVELALRHPGVHLEMACWSGAKPLRLPHPNQPNRFLPYCHYLNEDDFRAARDYSASEL